MRFLFTLILIVSFVSGCTSKKKETAPKNEPAAEKTPEPPKVEPPKPAPAEKYEITDRGGLSDADITLVKDMTRSLITKAISSRIEPLVDKMFRQMGRDNFSQSYPLFVKGAVASFTNIGVKLVLDAAFKKLGKKVTQEIVDKIVKPMIAEATKAALDNAYKKMMGK
ncbi:hypothetical protein KKF84_10770 [Myxococcota bacterium]|nr:hypothetical protein [Myxococcota bacterium]MBU1535794.1 hypothetical protein [Myxococcota bacterium]